MRELFTEACKLIGQAAILLSIEMGKNLIEKIKRRQLHKKNNKKEKDEKF